MQSETMYILFDILKYKYEPDSKPSERSGKSLINTDIADIERLLTSIV